MYGLLVFCLSGGLRYVYTRQLLFFLKKSSLGLHMRAVAQNREMARALSIKSNWVDAATFGLGSGIAGIAGVVLSPLTHVGPNCTARAQTKSCIV